MERWETRKLKKARSDRVTTSQIAFAVILVRTPGDEKR
jgi:hypothetical protein